MTISKISTSHAKTGPDGDLLLAGGAHMSMRLWKEEHPQDKEAHRSNYETLGYVISGRAELTIEGTKVTLEPGDSYLVPANAEHTYKIIEKFTALETISPAMKR